MKVLVIGCGRVGSSVALELNRQGWDVTAIDENEDVLQRLGENWSGGFVVGHGMDMAVLREAGIEDALERLGERWPGEFHVGHGLDSAVLEAAGIASADLVIVATDGDNTNLVIAQVAKRRFNIKTTVVRVLDPARAALYEDLGLWTVCPTQTAIKVLTEAVTTSTERAEAPA